MTAVGVPAARLTTGAASASGGGSAVAAIDLGATSGRVIVGGLVAGAGGLRLRTRQTGRFANDPVHTRDGLHWDLLALYRGALLGLAAAEREAPGEIGSIGVDSWAVDYGLLRGGRLLGLPYHYRDERGAAAVPTVHRQVGEAELFARSGLQHLDFNTVFQLSAEDPEVLSLAERMLLIPDLIGYWLTGREAAERSNASTTGLLSPVTREWDLELADRLGIPHRILPPLVDAGSVLGALNGEAQRVVGRSIPVVSVGSHDTASAVAAIPNTGGDFAYVSCGTWGLVGLELDAPVLTDEVRRANFTNEGGVDGRTRFLRNVMGTWLFSESLRHWEPGASEAERAALLVSLLEEAGRIAGPVPIFDVDDAVFMAPGDIPGRILDWYRERGERAPSGRVETVRAIAESLAAAFAATVEEAARLADREVSVIHIVGGGSQNELLCRRLAARSGLPVVAGPVEATAMGNLLLQARALGRIGSGLEALRGVVERSARVVRYLPE